LKIKTDKQDEQI